MCLNIMGCERNPVGVTGRAGQALEWLLPGVSADVFSHCFLVSECSPTLKATEWFLASVNHSMSFQLAFVSETSNTYCTEEGLSPRVKSLVYLQSGFVSKRLWTLSTEKNLRVAMLMINMAVETAGM
jgi:predicted acyltransferase